MQDNGCVHKISSGSGQRRNESSFVYVLEDYTESYVGLVSLVCNGIGLT